MEVRGSFIQRPLSGLRKWVRPPEFCRREHRGQSPLYPFISVIIPAHNEVDYLRETLRAIDRQTYRHHEVIVVANGCTDGTPDLARRRCHRLIVLSQKSLGVARNLGARMAKGDILVFLDADTVMERRALEIVAKEFRPGCAAGTLRGCPDRSEFRYRMMYGFKNLIHRCHLHPGSSGVIVCWREQFLRIGGFDEGLEVRENSELMRRLMLLGEYKYVDTACATTSMRRFEQKGFMRMLWLWCRVWGQTHFGDLHKRHYETVR